MPSWPIRGLLLALWLGGLAWHAAVEWRPFDRAERLTFRELLGDRPSDETATWRLLLDGAVAGEATTSTETLPEGGHSIKTAATLDGKLIAGMGDHRARLSTEARVSPFGRLREFHAAAQLDGAGLRVALVGTVVGAELEIRVESSTPPLPEGFRGPFKGPYDDRTPLAGAFAPLDRLPGLAVGRRWTTRAFDPMQFIGPRLPGLAPKDTPTMHEVVGVETVRWADAATDCFVVEDRQGAAVGKTYVRRTDGLVVRQEARQGRSTIVLERRR